MTFDYASLATEAQSLLQEFGASVTIRKKSVGTYDPATGQNAQGTPTDVTITAVLFDFGQGQQNGPGGLIQGGDKRMLIAAGTTVPALEDTVIAQGVQYVILGIGTVNPAGTPVIYDVHLRT